MKNHNLPALFRRMLGLLTAISLGAAADPPVVKTVPWVDLNPLVPHSTYSGKTITLKGTSDQQGANYSWTWDFGDGSPVATGTVTDRFAVQSSHAYTGPVGTVYTARLTVRNTATGETGTRPYYVKMEAKSIESEVNVAIDEGLWYLHKSQSRWTSGSIDYGDWRSSLYGGNAASFYISVTACNLNAFEVNGYLETGNPENPYTETVARGLKRLFEFLTYRQLGQQNVPTFGAVNPDTNLNGIGILVNQDYPYYQGGMVMDAIVASGTPNAISTTGGVNIIGRTYADIIQDMVDDHAWAQYDAYPGGGWRYSANQFPDNSACQWAAIGLIAAERNWGLTVPQWVKDWNVPWLKSTQAANGSFGYTDTGTAWGPYATTPSGMVQMVMVGIGRDMSRADWPSWNNAETFLYNNFVSSSSGAYYQIKDYYYGLFSFVKSMILHRTDADGDGDLDPQPIHFLRNASTGSQINWYAAEKSAGDPADGVARTLVGDQHSNGYWWAHNYDGSQYPFETSWAIMMLRRSIVDTGVPVAVAKAIPNPALVGQVITLDGSDSFHLDGSRAIVSWEWDTDSDGIFDATGPFATTSFASLGLYPITLRVMDNNIPPKSADTVVSALVSTPPVPPTADANGPYIFCPDRQPWFLDARRSVNPDEDRSETHDPPYPGDTIQEYAWDLDDDGAYDDAFGATPDVTDWFTAYGTGKYLIRLRVTDTTGTSYPSFPDGDLSDTTTAQVFVLAQDDPNCNCITLTATPILNRIDLSWTPFSGASSYNIYRSLVSGGPYIWLGDTPDLAFSDAPGKLTQVYYYVVRPAALNGDELCQSNQVEAEPLHPEPTISVQPSALSNLARYYHQVSAASSSYGRMQLGIFVGDTGSSFVAGPFPNGGILYLRTHQRTATLRPEAGPVAGFITVQGHAELWAQDPAGQESRRMVIP